MAVIVVSPTRSSAALNNYVLNDKKDQQGERYVMASGHGGLLVSVAEKQMRDVRKKYNKDKPGAFVQAYHVIQSFGKDELDPDDPDSWLTAQRLGRAFAEDRFPERQVLVVTQRDGKTGCVHNHIVVNSVDSKTGKSLNSSIVMHARLVQEHDRVLAEQGFEQRADIKQTASDAKERFERGEPSRMRRKGETETRELREFQRHILWETECDIADEFGEANKPEPFSLTVLKSYIARALSDPDSTDWVSLVQAGRKHGVDIQQRGKKGRGISYGMLREQPDGTHAEPSPSDKRRCSSLGVEFEMDAVERALADNRAAQQAQSAAAHVVAPPAQVTMPAPPVTQLSQSEPSIEAKMRAALDDFHAREDVKSQRRIADYLVGKASDAGTPDHRAAPARHDERSTGPVPGATPLSGLRDAQGVQEVTEVVATPGLELRSVSPSFAVAGGDPIDALAQPEKDGAKPRGIDDRKRSADAMPTPSQQHTGDATTAPGQRKLRERYPELFDDAERGAKSAMHSSEFEV
jgi:hypothetical protein